MVREFAEFDVKPGTEQEFIAGVVACKEMFLRAAGCHGVELHRSVESLQHFVLNIEWDDVAAHQAFRESPDFGVWRGTVGGFLRACQMFGMGRRWFREISFGQKAGRPLAEFGP